MEPLLAQLKTFPGRLLALPMLVKVALISAVVVGLGLVFAARVVTDGAKQDYVFTSLSAADSAACAQALTAASIPFSVEANGAAIAVPADKVHTARLLLAGQGLPRGAGVGFEIFDKGDLGVSEFTQRVNLQRAQEGELARTIMSLGPVREARVHLTLPKKGLFRDEDKAGQAAVMVRLHPGRALDDGALAGIKHLVASAVPGLSPSAVSVIDDAGALLGDQTGGGPTSTAQKKLERSLEERGLAVLEPSVGKDAVVARVTAELDDADEGATISTYNPEGAVLRSERTRADSRSDNVGLPAAIAGAAANAALEEPGLLPSDEKKSEANRNETTRSWEITNTITRRTTRGPRLKRLSVAVVIDETTPPRTPADVARLAELARRAVGYDEDRGDQLERTALPFVHPKDVVVDATAAAPLAVLPAYVLPAGIGVGVLALIAVAALVLSARRRHRAEAAAATARAEIEADRARREQLVLGAASANDGVTVSVSSASLPALSAAPTATEQAMALVFANPQRAAMVLEAWLEEDQLKAAARVAIPATTSTTAAEAAHV